MGTCHCQTLNESPGDTITTIRGPHYLSRVMYVLPNVPEVGLFASQGALIFNLYWNPLG